MSQRTSGGYGFGLVVLGLVVFSVLGFVWSPPLSADIEITEDDWDEFTELSAIGTPPMAIVTTLDERKSLHITRPSGDKSVIYQLNVTKLPGGENRFPVEVISRQVMDSSNGFTIRNLTIDPEPDPNFQNSFLSILMNDGGAGGPALARDERWIDFEGEDLAGTIGMSGLQVGDPTADTGINPDDVTTTINATLELELGVNILRIDPTDPRDLPAYQPDCGSQIFTFTIGPGEPDLQGELVVSCGVSRAISSSGYAPGDTVSVTVTAKNISGAITITETFPNGWTVPANGGGTVAGSTIKFTIAADSELAYTLKVPAGFCEVTEISGDYSGLCEGNVKGDSLLECVEIPPGATLLNFDDEGPQATDELEDFFDFLGFDPSVGGNWTVATNNLNAQDPSLALHTSSNGGGGPEVWFNRVALLKAEVFEAEDIFYSVDITWDDNDRAGVYFRFNGSSGVALENSFYYVWGRSDNRGIRLLRVKDGVFEVLADGDQPNPIFRGSTANITIEAVEDEITVLFDGEPILGMDPYVDDDPLLGCGRIGVGQESNPTFYDNFIFSDEGQGLCSCEVNRSLSSTRYEPGDTVTVTVTARNVTGATTITETFPDGWTVANAGGGTVAGNTITFNLNADGEVTYELTVPAGFCETASFEGTTSGAGGCDGEVTGDSKIRCIGEGTGGITISGDDWDFFTDRGSPGQLPEIVITDDGVKSLVFDGLGNDGLNAFVTYKVNVSQLPARTSRFPISLLARRIDENGVGFTVKNLTIDPEVDFDGCQLSFVSMTIGTEERIARDDEGGEDAGVNPVPRIDDLPTLSTGITAPDITETTDATIELELGENLLRLDTMYPLDLPGCSYDDGAQIFTLVIGAGEPELQGGFPCIARRSVSPSFYSPGDTVSVTVTAKNLSGATAITDTFPNTWTVADAGGGTVAGNNITFNIDAEGEVSYELTVPAGFCETASFEGTMSGAGGCDGEVTGDAEIRCLGTGGIRISGDDWENYLELDVDTPGTTPEPEIVETEDGMKALHLRGFPPGGADNDMFATYRVIVTQLPGGGPGPERFPITAVVRNVGGNAGMAIRNLTVGPIDDQLPFPDNIAQQESFVCVGIHADLGGNVRAMGTGPQPFDPCFDQLVEDPAGTIIVEPWGDAGQDVGVSPFAATDAPGSEIGILQTVDVMLDLVLGENILRIDSTDVRDLPCAYEGESGHQLFTLIIGANEPDLKDDRNQPSPGASLKPGDVNGDAAFNISDPVKHLNFLFSGDDLQECFTVPNSDPVELSPTGLAILDFNGDGDNNITDAVAALTALFGGGDAHALGKECALVEGGCVSNCQ